MRHCQPQWQINGGPIREPEPGLAQTAYGKPAQKRRGSQRGRPTRRNRTNLTGRSATDNPKKNRQLTQADCFPQDEHPQHWGSIPRHAVPVVFVCAAFYIQLLHLFRCRMASAIGATHSTHGSAETRRDSQRLQRREDRSLRTCAFVSHELDAVSLLAAALRSAEHSVLDCVE
jgi:hypothetical protein